jgi:hypothetical protein
MKQRANNQVNSHHLTVMKNSASAALDSPVDSPCVMPPTFSSKRRLDKPSVRLGDPLRILVNQTIICSPVYTLAASPRSRRSQSAASRDAVTAYAATGTRRWHSLIHGS